MVLTDVTAEANDMSIVSTTPFATGISTPMKNGNLRVSGSSHFMTPTFASKRAGIGEVNNRATRSALVEHTKAGSGNSLQKSAARRVGSRRVVNETAGGRKEKTSRQSRVVPFPDKLSVTTSSKILDPPATPPKDNIDATRVSPLNKPLPAAPSTELDISSPVGSSASLVEATDNPLPGFGSVSSIDTLEDWLVMQPSCAMSVGSLHRIMRDDGNALKHQHIMGEKERYPKLGNAATHLPHLPPDADQIPVSRYSPMYTISRKEVSSFDLCKSSSPMELSRSVHGLSSPFGNAVELLDRVLDDNTKPKSSHRLSTGPAAVESSQDLKASSTPRQTRTSSLRAYLSARQLAKDEQTKGLDLTALRTTTNYRTRKEIKTHRSNGSVQSSLRTQASAPTLREKNSGTSLYSSDLTESLGGHAPAKFVGGSRRPVSIRRLGSRSSNQNASKGSFPIISSRPPSQASSNHSDGLSQLPDKRRASSDKPCSIIERQVKARKSSIPVPTHAALNVLLNAKNSSPVTPKSTRGRLTPRKTPRDEFEIFKGHSSAALVKELEVEAMSSFKNRGKNRGSTQIFEDAKESRSLAAIEESPQHAYHTKRLSTKAPEFGPSLKISPSAEHFIMGADSKNILNANKENQPIHEKMTKRFIHKATNGASNQNSNFISPATTIRKSPGRPFSSDGVLRTSPHRGLIDPKAREKKVKSADMSSTLSVNLDSALEPSREKTDTSKVSMASSPNDPFFDAQEQPPTSSSELGQKSPPKQEEEKEVFDEAGWISPVKSQTEDVRTQLERLKSRSSTLNTDGVARDLEDRQKEKILVDPTNLNLETKDIVQRAGHFIKQEQFTPIHSRGKTPSRLDSHPPRSSSRVAHPKYTTAPAGVPVPVTIEKVPRTPPKDMVRLENTQNNLGSRHGLANTQIGLSRPVSKQTTSLRNSIARDSFKSNGSHSVSRNPFSNFRHLFNKRASTPDQSTPAIEMSTKGKKSKTKNQKISTTSNDSPFPPISNIHQIHRPSIASSSRANTPRNNIATTRSNSLSSPSTTYAATPATPSIMSPTPTELSTTTTLAMTLLDQARRESCSPKKEKLLEMGKIMVDAITQARDAEKAATEATLACKRAEMARDVCQRMVGEVGRMVEGWKGAQLDDSV